MSSQQSPPNGSSYDEHDWLSWVHQPDDNSISLTADATDPADVTANSLDTADSLLDYVSQPRLSDLQANEWETADTSLVYDFTPNLNDQFADSALSSSGYYGVPSDSSAGSIDSAPSSTSPARIRRRRRQIHRNRAQPRDRETNDRRYQCTFCTDAFKTKHDWQRHETTMHLSLEQWKCSMYGPTIQHSDGHTYCVFCNFPDPSDEHPELHNYSACVAQPDEARLFHRKDHLRQHLRLFHRGCSFNESMKTWLSSIDNVKSRCGFCDAEMGTWTDRQKHLAVHFRTGSDMKEWKGDRGFDQEIDEIVENDIPAFLIGDQRLTMEPFSASKADHRTNEPLPASHSSDEPGPGLFSSQMEVLPSSHSHREIERRLLRYVSTEISQGRVPSDRQIQIKTSEIMYGPDNAWDATWADNPQWLDMFRKKAGLISLPLSGGKNAFVGFDAI
ncbi:hypothetical protein FSHL1_006516 [Fusarium sambucinum]